MKVKPVTFQGRDEASVKRQNRRENGGKRVVLAGSGDGHVVEPLVDEGEAVEVVGLAFVAGCC